jgi:hypothetical protein
MLKTYMVFDRHNGTAEGASLVFAHSVQEARKVGWQALSCDFIGEYIDTAATLLRNMPWLFEEAQGLKYANDEAHVIVSPLSCSSCGYWGVSKIGCDGLCDDCRNDSAAQLPMQRTDGGERALPEEDTSEADGGRCAICNDTRGHHDYWITGHVFTPRPTPTDKPGPSSPAPVH